MTQYQIKLRDGPVAPVPVPSAATDPRGELVAWVLHQEQLSQLERAPSAKVALGLLGWQKTLAEQGQHEGE